MRIKKNFTICNVFFKTGIYFVYIPFYVHKNIKEVAEVEECFAKYFILNN